MSSMQTSNPAFSGTVFGDWERADRRGSTMTVGGTAGKAMALLLIVVACAAVTWNQAATGRLNPAIMMGAGIAGFVLALITIFKQSWSPITAPLYSACQGVFLGAISLVYNWKYPGLVPQAVGLTFATAFVMLFVYATGMIKVTGRLAAGITAATGAMALFYMGSLLLSFFGINGGVNLIQSTSTFGVAISAFVVGLAAFNLLLDFDMIEQGSRYEAPKYMEWYGAFGLMVTLIWLYMSILRLLSKLQDRR